MSAPLTLWLCFFVSVSEPRRTQKLNILLSSFRIINIIRGEARPMANGGDTILLAEKKVVKRKRKSAALYALIFLMKD